MRPDVYKWMPVTSFNDIDVKELDLLDDAWGISSEFADLFVALSIVEPEPSESLVEGLISRIEAGKE